MSSSSEALQIPLERPSGRAPYELVLPWPLAGDQPKAAAEPFDELGGASALGAHSGAFEAWQDLIAEIRELIRVIDERNRDAADTGPRQRDKIVGDPLRVPDKRQSAHSMHLETALFLEHFLTDARRRDVALTILQQRVDYGSGEMC